MAQGKRLAVIGGPGCGKTTVLQHIAWTLAESLRGDDATLAADRLGLAGALPLPIYVPLSLYAGHRESFARHADPRQRQLATFIKDYLLERQAGLHLPDDFFATLLSQGQDIILLLDGLDEVPSDAARALVTQAVQDLTYGRPQIQVVLTSRTQAYQGKAMLGGDFRLVRVLPLAPAQVESLIQRAYEAIFPTAVEKDERLYQTTNLIEGVKKLEADRQNRLGEGEAERLISSPLLVRMLLIVHFNLRRLPDQRAELYLEVIETLLTAAHHPDEAVAQRLARLGGDWRLRRDMLQHLAFQMHSQAPPGESAPDQADVQAGREIDERALVDLLARYLVERQHKAPAAAEVLVADFIATSRQRGGILEEVAGRYRFSHLGFQEFLTARYLAEVQREAGRIVETLERGDYIRHSWWREPILLTAGYLYLTALDTANAFIRRLARLVEAEAVHEALPAAAQLAAAEVAATAFLEWGGAEDIQQALAGRLTALLEDGALTGADPRLRATAGTTLAHLGDPRPGILTVASGSGETALPEWVWCEVPAGPFLLGANDDEAEAWEDEKPQHELPLPTFYIARYPLTNAQYAPFIEAGGYDNPRWWTALGWAWRQGQAPAPDLSYIADETARKTYADWLAGRPVDRRHEPFFWQDEGLNVPNQPVVGVTWYESLAYCAWLTDSMRGAGEGGYVWRAGKLTPWTLAAQQAIRLPTEAEWEKGAGWNAARGHKRVYAWGDEWVETEGNLAEQVGRPSAVGVFPAGAAPCGALDMSGNVWEWTLSLWGGADPDRPGFVYPLAEAEPQTGPGEREEIENAGRRVVRGGSWYHDSRLARVSYRYVIFPDDFVYVYGFRVVVAPVLT